MQKFKNTVITPVCLSLLAAGVYSKVVAGELLFTLASSADHRELGSGFAAVGDINGDGVVDVAVADRSARVSGFLGSGIVHLVSGVDGSLLRSYEGVPAQSQGFGSSLTALDADGDGILDLAVGSPGQSSGGVFGAGAVRIYSGADGTLLQTIVGPSSSQLGSSLANAGDQDGDGFDDLYAGAPFGNGSKGIVLALSSATGGTLRTYTTEASVSTFGVKIATVGDVDGDGLADVAISAPGFQNQAGRVIIARSSDGSTAAQIVGSGNFNRLGESLAPAADVDGDGQPDLMVGSFSGGTARLVSGVDLSTLVDLSIPTLATFRQLTVGGSIDFDQDGIADWLIGSPALQTLNGQLVGGIRVISGADLSTLFEFTATAPNSGLGLTMQILPGLGMAAGEPSLPDPVSGGRGLAHVWQVDAPVLVLDSDGDGVIDTEDCVIHSIMTATVLIQGIDSKVPNRVNEKGITLADRHAKLGPISSYRKPVLYLVKATLLNLQLKQARLINQGEFVKLTEAALKATVNAGKTR